MAAPVRIELHSGASWDPAVNRMAPVETAEIRLARPDGRIDGRAKPFVVLVAGSRPEVLRQLADWMNQRGDPSLTGLAAEYAGAARVRFTDEGITANDDH